MLRTIEQLPWKRLCLEAIAIFLLMIVFVGVIIPINGRSVRSYNLEVVQYRHDIQAKNAEIKAITKTVNVITEDRDAWEKIAKERQDVIDTLRTSP